MKNLKLLFILIFTLLPVFSTDGAITNVYDFLRNPGTFVRLVKSLESTGFDTPLIKTTGGKKYTILAPTDRAFEEFGRLGLLRGNDDKSKEAFKKFVGYHLIKGKKTVKNLKRKRQWKTASGERLETKDFKSNILYSMKFKNGVVHVTDKVLVSPEMKKYLFAGG